MQIYALKMFNFFRFGEENNSVVFDVKKESIGSDTSIDSIYDKFKENPVEYVSSIKEEGVTPLISITGIIGDDAEVSNGAGKSTILEAIVFALYNKIVRKNVNSDKKSDAGLSVVLNFNGVYPKDMRESYVEMFFEENDQLYRVKRGRKFSKNHKSSDPYLEFECLNEEISGDSSLSSHRTSSTTKKIEEVIDRDYDTFCSSLMFGQNDSGKFLTGTDKVKKDMLISMLHFDDAVQKYLSEVRDRKKNCQKEVSDLESKISVLEDRIGGKDVEKIKNEIISLNKKNDSLKDEISKMDSEINKLSSSNEMSRLNEIKSDGKSKKEKMLEMQKNIKDQTSQWEKMVEEADSSISEYERQVKLIKTKIDTLNADKEKVTSSINSFNEDEYISNISKVEKAKKVKPNYISKLDECRKLQDETLSKLSGFESDLKPLEKELSELKNQIDFNKDKDDNFVCDKCKSKVSKQHIFDEISKNNEKISNIKEKISEFSSELEKKKQSTNEVQSKLSKIDEWINKEIVFRSQKENFEESKKKLVNIDSEILEKTNELSSCLEKSSKMESSKSKYLSNIKDVEDKNKSEIEKIKAELKELSDEYKKIEKDQSYVANKISEIKSNKDSMLKEIEDNIGLIGGSKETIKSLEIDKDSMDSCIKTLNEKRVYLKRILVLEEICGLEGIQTKIVKKYLPLLNVYIKEVMDIISNGSIEEEVIIDKHGCVDIAIRGATASIYNMLSGGEKMVIRLATDIGLAMLSFAHCAQKPEMICLDEIFGPLDGSHREMVFDLLDKLRSKFNRVLVISHEKLINEIISNKIIVGKNIGEYGLSYIKSMV